jgi:prepilin peptidase CpaA
MNPVVFFFTAILVTTAAVIDIRSRRIPNWLVIFFLVAALVFGLEHRGLPGLRTSLMGMALAVIVLGPPCWLRAIGMGDLKLCVAVGAWIGFTQLTIALVITAIAGGIIGILWMSRSGKVGEAFDGAGEILFSLPRRGFSAHPAFRLDNPRANTLPYAPAIAIGTLFSFLC